MSPQLFNALLHSEEVLDNTRMAMALVVLQRREHVSHKTHTALLFLISFLCLLSIPCHFLSLQFYEFLPAFFLCFALSTLSIFVNFRFLARSVVTKGSAADEEGSG